MSDDDERDEHEKHMREHIKALDASSKRQMDSMMASMMEQMAPLLMGGQMLGDEAKAWDLYASSAIRDTDDVAVIVDVADRLLAERRKRFNKETFAEQMRGMLPSGRTLCDQPVLKNDGTDTGTRCTRNAGHEGNVHY
jgi:hypothetical protein